MRFLHTADWHLGQTFYGHERDLEHQRFLDWLLETLEAEAADALLVAGDLFDNSNPSAASQEQLYRFLVEAKKRLPELDVVAIAGNHDSAGRLEAPSPLLGAFGVRVVGRTRRLEGGGVDAQRLIFPLHGPGGEVEALCLAVPFLRPGDVPRVEGEGDAYLEGVALLYRQALEHALELRAAGQAIVAMGHCHMRGGEVSEDSERRLVVGGAEALSAEIFGDELAYVALGHLHRPQKVGSREGVRYCGSPLPMSFSEIHYRHQVVRVDLEGEEVREIEPLPIPRTVELLRVPEKPAPLDEALEALAALELPDRPFDEQPYLQVRISLDGPEPGLRARVEAALDGQPVRLARIETVSARRGGENEEARPFSLDDLGRLEPEDVFRRLWRDREEGEPPDELLAALRELILVGDDAGGGA